MSENSQTTQSELKSPGIYLTAEQVLGVSPAMAKVRQVIEKLAATNVPILIQGEGGTGKKILASVFHRRYPGEAWPFLNIAAREFGSSLIQGQASLAGFPSGTADGHSRLGDFSCQGTVCISEVGELRAGAQWKLMQMLHGDPPLVVGLGGQNGAGFRVICTSARPLENEVEAGRFRQDVFYCINAVGIRVAPLRERREDIPSLVQYFFESYGRDFDCNADQPSARLIEFLQDRPWHGNIRELANVMKRYVLLGSEDAIMLELSEESDMAQALPSPSPSHPISLKILAREAARTLERKVLLKTLRENQWNRRRAARALNISYRALLYKVKEAGLPRKQSMLGRSEIYLRAKRVPVDASEGGAI